MVLNNLIGHVLRGARVRQFLGESPSANSSEAGSHSPVEISLEEALNINKYTFFVVITAPFPTIPPNNPGPKDVLDENAFVLKELVKYVSSMKKAKETLSTIIYDKSNSVDIAAALAKLPSEVKVFVFTSKLRYIQEADMFRAFNISRELSVALIERKAPNDLQITNTVTHNILKSDNRPAWPWSFADTRIIYNEPILKQVGGSRETAIAMKTHAERPESQKASRNSLKPGTIRGGDLALLQASIPTTTTTHDAKETPRRIHEACIKFGVTDMEALQYVVARIDYSPILVSVDPSSGIPLTTLASMHSANVHYHTTDMLTDSFPEVVYQCTSVKAFRRRLRNATEDGRIVSVVTTLPQLIKLLDINASYKFSKFRPSMRSMLSENPADYEERSIFKDESAVVIQCPLKLINDTFGSHRERIPMFERVLDLRITIDEIVPCTTTAFSVVLKGNENYVKAVKDYLTLSMTETKL